MEYFKLAVLILWMVVMIITIIGWMRIPSYACVKTRCTQPDVIKITRLRWSTEKYIWYHQWRRDTRIRMKKYLRERRATST